MPPVWDKIPKLDARRTQPEKTGKDQNRNQWSEERNNERVRATRLNISASNLLVLRQRRPDLSRGLRRVAEPRLICMHLANPEGPSNSIVYTLGAQIPTKYLL